METRSSRERETDSAGTSEAGLAVHAMIPALVGGLGMSA